MRRGSELLAEVAEPDFGRTEEFVIGIVHEGVGHALDQGQSLGQQLRAHYARQHTAFQRRRVPAPAQFDEDIAAPAFGQFAIGIAE